MHVLFPLSRLHLPLLHLRTNPANLKMSMTFAEAAALRKAAQRSVRSRRTTRLTSHTSEVQRPPIKTTPEPIVYESVARPGAYYERPKLKRDLPVVNVRTLSKLTRRVLADCPCTVSMALAIGFRPGWSNGLGCLRTLCNESRTSIEFGCAPDTTKST